MQANNHLFSSKMKNENFKPYLEQIQIVGSVLKMKCPFLKIIQTSLDLHVFFKKP